MKADIEPATERTIATRTRGESVVLESIRRSLVTPYWKYTFLPLSFATIGMVIASIESGWSWPLWGAFALSIWFADQGFKAIDLSAPDLAVELNATIQRVVGVLQVGVALSIGIWLALERDPWILVLYVVPVILGFVYDLEWFGGRFHDRTYATGWGNVSLVIGWVPTFLGYYLLAGEFSPGMALFSIGPMLSIGAVLWPEQDAKDEIYEVVGIEYTRTTARDDQRLRRRFVAAQLLVVVGYTAMAVGLAIEFLF